MNYYAHSAKGDVPAQSYTEHAQNVRALAESYAEEMRKFALADFSLFLQIIRKAAEYHDLGKLHPENQQVLSGELPAKSLPLNHVDAGSAHFLSEDTFSGFSAAVIHAHHRGYPNFIHEKTKDFPFRDEQLREQVDKALSHLETIHHSLISSSDSAIEENISMDRSVYLRLLLSCLSDADHTDTARNYRQYPSSDKTVELRAAERLKQLDEYIDEKRRSAEAYGIGDAERNVLRNSMYLECRNSSVTGNVSSCDSPVGSGKTTAVMAHLLAQAEKRGLRRIFIVLPFTNIITQSVDVYRKALTLPGENPSDVVAELHHRADFESLDARHLTALWRSPIIVTTAVSFFETFASNTPSSLRRLHELPGSAVFVDESHAALPSTLLPLAWKWIKTFADEWGCYWVLASGSLNRFWNIPEIANPDGQTTKAYPVPEIVSDKLRFKLSHYESQRIAYQSDLSEKSETELADWILQFAGPRIVILNTVQSAAVLAKFLAERCGRKNVEHISTALTPDDRRKTVERVKMRLKDADDSDWTLVATSCVEAGMDFSFRNGFREVGSLSSLLQAAGRVNREGLSEDSEMWSFCISEAGLLKKNPGLESAARVLKRYLRDGREISPSLSTEAIQDELRMFGTSKQRTFLVDSESNDDFPTVEREFKVIDANTCLAVVDVNIAEAVRNGNINWRELQTKSVHVSKYKLEELHVPLLHDELYYWNLQYDDFTGYMAGIISNKNVEQNSYIF